MATRCAAEAVPPPPPVPVAGAAAAARPVESAFADALRRGVREAALRSGTAEVDSCVRVRRRPARVTRRCECRAGAIPPALAVGFAATFNAAWEFLANKVQARAAVLCAGDIPAP